MLHAEFSAMDFTLNIVSKCRFFLFILRFTGSEKVLEDFSSGSWKVLDFLSVKVGTLGICPMTSPAAAIYSQQFAFSVDGLPVWKIWQ